MVGGGLLGVDLSLLHVSRELRSLNDFEAFLFTRIGDVDVAFKSKDTLLGWHLEHQVRVMGYNHEFGECGSTKYGVVGTFKIRDYEVDIVDAEVIGRAELYLERDLFKRRRALTQKDPPKLGVVGPKVCLS